MCRAGCSATVFVLLAAAAATDVPAELKEPERVELGFFYFVKGYNQNWHSGSHWPWVEHGFHKDLGVLASLGVKTIKIGFAASDSGVVFKEAGGAEIDRREVRKIASHMGPVLAQCAAHGIRPVVVFFLNEYYLRGPNGFYPQNEPNWYEWSFAQWGEEEGGEAFGEVLGEWIGCLVEAIEATPQAEVVLYYNVFTEIAYALEDYSPVVTSRIFRKVLEKANVPEGKLGADAWPHFETSVEPMKADLEAMGRKLDWTEVHSYAKPPARAETLEEKFRQTREAFPEARVVLGEFGAPYALWGDEQPDVFAEFLDEAARVGAGLALNWGLWDYRPRDADAGDHRYGLGYALGDPRDAFGLVCERYSALRGGDFETAAHPWSVSRGPGELTGETGNAATGERFLRFRAAPGARGPLSIQSEPIRVTGPRLALNAYVRATGTVSVRIHCLDERGWSHDDGRYTPQRCAERPAPDRWSALQGLWGGHVFEVPETASEVKVEVLLAMPAEEPPADGHVLDIDAVSINMLSPTDADTDGDGILDDDEIVLGTDPGDPDSDDDGLSDGAEVTVHQTDPNNADSDGDGATDGAEISAGTDPLLPEDAPSVPAVGPLCAGVLALSVAGLSIGAARRKIGGILHVEHGRYTPQRCAERPAPGRRSALQGLRGGRVFEVPETASEAKVESLLEMPAEEPPADGRVLDIDAVSINMLSPLE